MSTGIEGNFRQLLSIYQTRPTTQTTALTKAISQASKDFQNADWFVSNLRTTLTSVGFREDVTQNVMSTDREIETRIPMTRIGSGAVYGILSNQTHSGREGAWSADKVE